MNGAYSGDTAPEIPEGPENVAPVIILTRPQLGENIGTAARAMLNFGLEELRLVNPREGWHKDKAYQAASGAGSVIDNAQVFASLEEAVADLQFVLAATARRRDMAKPVFTPEESVRRLRSETTHGMQCGVVFGPERTGLTNDEVVCADGIMRVPVNPSFSSLNLAQSVVLVAYEWRKAYDSTIPAIWVIPPETRPANRDELIGFYIHLESALDEAGFLRPPEKRPSMVRNIRNFFQRGRPTEQEIRTLRGIISALTHQ
ncbi:MAG: RNA methyltransferase [Parvularculales bacterium]